ncbi:MAG: thioredoxin domain-containing protein [Miniphocaeibacter sp.]|uniref:thioredoxin family protein n=1 Tax=Miniphocaeibacter sp. TaxID=3100973 RepID=UPI003BB09DA2
MNITTENFQQEVLDSDIPVVIDFWKEDCVPCAALSPIIDEIAKEAEGYKVYKVNIKENLELARKYVIFSAPTTMIFKDGKMVKAISGYQEKETIVNTIKEYL